MQFLKGAQLLKIAQKRLNSRKATSLRINIAPAKMKIPLSLFIFPHTKYIYLKRRKKFHSNQAAHKKLNEKVLEKKKTEHYCDVDV